MYRPRQSRWDISFCCNDPQTGMATGMVDFVEFGIGRGDFEFGTDLCDDHSLIVEGPYLTFQWHQDHFELGRRKYPCSNIKEWFGNWCWDACLVNTKTVRAVAQQLRDNRWSADEGSEILWNWWNKLCPET